jgi:hypothetical protein
MYAPNYMFPEGSRIAKKGVKVDLIHLDRVIPKNKKNKNILLKIDTEGYELNVLKGADKLLKITNTVIVESDITIAHLTELLNIMKKHQFEFVNIGSINFAGKDISSMDFIFKKVK